MGKKKRRRDGYWRYYHLAHTHELDSLVANIVSLVKENEPPIQVKETTTRKGRKPVHSWNKLVCICLIMVIAGYTFRGVENVVPRLDLPWIDEPYPDHITIWRAYQRIPMGYLETILSKTAYFCIKESNWEKGILASDSTGVDTDRYETVIRPSKKERKFVKVRRLVYLKYHIIAILDYLIILKARITTYRANDSPILGEMLRGFKELRGSIFNADRGYDAESIFERIYKLKMHPNIKQRLTQKGPKGSGHKRLRYRSKAAKDFNEEIYHYRGMVEAIFGAEESGEHGLKTRFRLTENREKWGQIIAIGWNLLVLNRLRSARHLGIKVMPTIKVN